MKNQYTKNEAWDIYKKHNKVKCNCGGPQYGTDHSPDCEIMLAWDDFKDGWDDGEYYTDLTA